MTGCHSSFNGDQSFFSVSGAPGSKSDIDFCVSTAPHESGLLGCSNDANIARDPFELLFLNGSGTVYLAILHYSGSFPNVMKYIWSGGVSDLEHATDSPTSYGHANAAGANAVGAADYRDTPAFGTAPPGLEDFSSAGGVPILFDTFGNRTNIERQKPDFTAPDGGNNTFFGRDVEPDGFPNFFGTSAAAPHAAGVGALLRQCLSSSSPGLISSALKASAVDIVRRQSGQGIGAGRDDDSGAGLIDAEVALRLACSGPPEADVAEKIGIWRARDQRFYLDYDGSGSWTPGDINSAPFGLSGDIPVVGDWNNDGVDQIGIWRPSDRRFYLDYDGSDSWTNRDLITGSFGFNSDIPVVGDWNGNGRDQIGVWRPSERRFYLDYDGSNGWTTGDTITAPFGFSSDIPVVGDWNGDGADQIGVWRSGSRRSI